MFLSQWKYTLQCGNGITIPFSSALGGNITSPVREQGVFPVNELNSIAHTPEEQVCISESGECLYLTCGAVLLCLSGHTLCWSKETGWIDVNDKPWTKVAKFSKSLKQRI